MLGAVQRAIRGIEVSEEILSDEIIKDTALGPGHYLGSEQTLAIMETEYLYQEVADRTSPDVWQENGSPDIRDKAEAQARQILSSHYPSYVDRDADFRLRERFPIAFSRADMGPESGRWRAGP